MKLVFTILTQLFLMTQPSLAWDVYKDKSDEGDVLWVAEQESHLGSLLNLVCIDDEIHIELYTPPMVSAKNVTFEFHVDRKPIVLIAGSIIRIDAQESAFVGLTRGDRPSLRTAKLINQIKAGNILFLGKGQVGKAVDYWSMKGSSRAITTILKRCK